MRVIFEAINSDGISSFLMSDELIDLIEKYTDPQATCRKVIEECAKRYPDEKLPVIRNVSIYKVNPDNTVDILSSDHVVLEYDGYYYDYQSKKFKESFKDPIDKIVPCVQRVIKNEETITRFDSNIKGYSIVG